MERHRERERERKEENRKARRRKWTGETQLWRTILDNGPPQFSFYSLSIRSTPFIILLYTILY